MDNLRPRLELRAGRLIDVVAGALHPSGDSLFVRDGRIEAIGPTAPGPVDRVIDLGARSVIPGLFNTHCHPDLVPPALFPAPLDIWRAHRHADAQRAHTRRLCLEHGVTTIRDAFCADLARRRALDRLPGPCVRGTVAVGPPGGYLTEGHGRAMRGIRDLVGVPAADPDSPDGGAVLFDRDASPQQVRDAVDRAIDERGAQDIKVGEQAEDLRTMKPTMTVMSQAQLDALADQARRRGAGSLIHHMSVATFRRAVRAGIGTLSHIPVDEDLDDADVAALVAGDLAIEPTLSVAYGLAWPLPGDPYQHHPEMVELARLRAEVRAGLTERFFVPGLADRADRSLSRLERGRARMAGLIDARPFIAYYSRAVAYGINNFRRLFAGGARIALGNDGGVPPCTPAMVGLELAIMNLALRHDGGLPPAAALRIATLASAEATGLTADLGSLTPGKRADLAVLDGDPLTDLQLIGAPVAALFQGGALVVDRCGLAGP